MLKILDHNYEDSERKYQRNYQLGAFLMQLLQRLKLSVM